MGCSADCARQEIENLRQQLQPYGLRERIEFATLERLSTKQINDILSGLQEKLREAESRLAEGVGLPSRDVAINAIMMAHSGNDDLTPGSFHWASRIYAALLKALPAMQAVGEADPTDPYSLNPGDVTFATSLTKTVHLNSDVAHGTFMAPKGKKFAMLLLGDVGTGQPAVDLGAMLAELGLARSGDH